MDVDDPSRSLTRAMVLVPTRELAEQVSAYLRSLVKYCEKDVGIANVSSGTTAHLQRYVYLFLSSLLLTGCNRSLLADKPDIVVSTPSKALALLQSKVR